MTRCEKLRINGVLTHEIGCTEAWRDQVRKCKWCGSEFKPEARFDYFCDGKCHAYYDGVEVDVEECDHSDKDSHCCLICGADLGEYWACRAEDAADARADR